MNLHDRDKIMILFYLSFQFVFYKGAVTENKILNILDEDHIEDLK